MKKEKGLDFGQWLYYLRKNKGHLITSEIYAKCYGTDIDTAKVELTALTEAGILTAYKNGRIEYKAR